VEQTSCSRGARAYDCVTYELTSVIEPAGLARLAQSIPQEALGMRVSVHEIIRTVRVTLETETMLPHRFEMTQKMRQTRELGSAVNITDVERRVSQPRKAFDMPLPRVVLTTASDQNARFCGRPGHRAPDLDRQRSGPADRAQRSAGRRVEA
jgi:hypothetical protein